jgi:diaminopimelate epimerase
VVAFGKYHGLGNDFLIVDLRQVDDAAIQDPANVRALCDRQFGIGGDGVLPILLPVTAGADARMRVINADGSDSEMCGNGLRCVVKYLYERGEVQKDRITIDTGAGPLACDVHLSNGKVSEVTVDMGRPRLTRAEIPMIGPADERCIDVAFGDLRLTAVSMGNPHAVFFVEQGDLMALATARGPALEIDPTFPRKANIELARMVSPKEIDLVVWERGCGITLACGTGACATAVAACLTGRAALDTELKVNLPGGSLAIRVAPDYRTVLMRGPAVHVFDGTVDPRVVAARPARPAR